MRSIIEIKDLSLIYKTERGSIKALEKINLEVRDKEFVSVIGLSGCGKTTLLKVVSGLIPPSSGKILINGDDPAVLRQNRQVGFIFQDPVLLPWKTALDNAKFLLQISGQKPSYCEQRAMAMLKLVGLEDFRDNFPRELSGGMKQRVSIARALSLNPILLLMDEPFGALDQITRDRMAFELLRIWSEEKKTVLFITHSIPEAVLLSDAVVVLTNRPGTIKSKIHIDLPRPRTKEMRFKEEFNRYIFQIQSELEELVFTD